MTRRYNDEYSEATEDQINKRDERKRECRRQYNARPEVKEYQKEWHKNYSKLGYAKKAHRESQARYRLTEKGKATAVKYRRKASNAVDDTNTIKARISLSF